jgi:thiamine-phosphate pyrophosphorylase
MKSIDWSFCLIADTEYLSRINFFTVIEKAAELGISLVQLRSKKTDSRTFLDTAFKIKKILFPLNIPFIINDRIDIALACQADGVHLGQKDLPLPSAREILGKNKIIGITAPNKKLAQKAELQGADYLGVGPVFHTESKEKAKKPMGIKQLSMIREDINIPILAVGGINPQNAAEVMATGVDGVAVISAVFGSKDPQSSIQKIIQETKNQKFKI